MTRQFRMSSDTPYLTCDRCGKSHNITDAEAARTGWVIWRGLDLCSSCAIRPTTTEKPCDH